MLAYPDLNPIAFSLGPLKVHWYGIMYLLGFAAAWWLARRRAAQPHSTWKPVDVDDMIFFGAIGVIVGGRLGWILFYSGGALFNDPLSLLKVWEGGMSFHGGLIGTLVALAIFARRRGRRVPDVFDFLAAVGGTGLFTGRVGNFINGELWGKPTDVPWAFVVDGVARHPSQLYEALLEGLVLLAILWWFTSKPRPRLAPSGLFLVLYGTFRFLVEFVRLPDADIGYLAFGWLTMGQVLTIPMLVIGIGMLAWAAKTKQPSGNYQPTQGQG